MPDVVRKTAEQRELVASAHQHSGAVAGGEHDDAGSLAHRLLQTTGCFTDSPQADWVYASEDLRSHGCSH